MKRGRVSYYPKMTCSLCVAMMIYAPNRPKHNIKTCVFNKDSKYYIKPTDYPKLQYRELLTLYGVKADRLWRPQEKTPDASGVPQPPEHWVNECPACNGAEGACECGD